jgi:geranylgeranyl diphosphate synthase type II
VITEPGTTAVGDDLVDRVLRDVGRTVRRAMLDEVPDGEPDNWLYRLIREYPSRPSKALRPSLCLAACRAFGGDPSDAVGVAVAIELLHNAFLVHDDIADGSERRRGSLTLPAEYGVPLALNAGDALAVMAYRTLRRAARRFDHALADRVFDEFETMAFRTLEGQATELGWRRESALDLCPDDYLHLVMHKTCWYTTIHPLRVGAVIATKGRADLRPLVRFGFYLGAAFQIRDDLLNLLGDSSLYGKEINGDLYEGKRSLVLVHLMKEATGTDRDCLGRYLALDREHRDPALVQEIRSLMDSYGSISFAEAYGRGIADAAFEAFEEAFADAQPGEDTDFIRALIPYMLGRRT